MEYPNQLKRLKTLEKLRCHKSQPMFSEASQAKWRERNAIPGFPIEMVSTLVSRSLVDEADKRSV